MAYGAKYCDPPVNRSYVILSVGARACVWGRVCVWVLPYGEVYCLVEALCPGRASQDGLGHGDEQIRVDVGTLAPEHRTLLDLIGIRIRMSFTALVFTNKIVQKQNSAFC